MPQQTIQLQAAWYRVAHNGWVAPGGSRPAIDAGLRGADDRFLRSILLTTAGQVRLAIESSQTSIASNDDLTSEFELNGSLEIIVGANSLLVALAGADMTETYRWTPSNSAEVIAFQALLSDVEGTESGQLIIRDFVPTLGPVDHAVDAGAVSWAFALPEPAVTHTPAVGTLALSDFDDTGLDVETAALLEASAPGTSGNNFYRDSTRGGSDSPIEGELGVGPGETLISRMRRASAANLTLNDNNLPVQLPFDTYFGTGGAGRDLTLYLQTASDGLVSFTVAGAFLSAGGNWLNVTLPAAARTLLGNLATGDRFIFALARAAAATTVDHAVDAGSVAWAFALPQPAVTHTLADGTTDHAVNAGAVLWAFALPQPSVTHTLAPGTTAHAVDAGAVAWAFHLPQPSVTHSLPTRAAIWAQYAITINTSPVTRFWTGRGRLDYLGDLYEGGGRAVGVGEIELVSGNPDRRLTITLSSIPTSVRAEFLQDVGAVEVEVALIFSADRGSTWRAAPLSYSGRLSSPTMVNGRLTVELETLRGDVDHGEVRYWSHEDQERRFPGDKGMEYMRQLAQKGTETSWPP